MMAGYDSAGGDVRTLACESAARDHKIATERLQAPSALSSLIRTKCFADSVHVDVSCLNVQPDQNYVVQYSDYLRVFLC